MVNESSNVGKIDVGLMFMVESVIVVLGEGHRSPSVFLDLYYFLSLLKFPSHLMQ